MDCSIRSCLEDVRGSKGGLRKCQRYLRRSGEMQEVVRVISGVVSKGGLLWIYEVVKVV